MTFLPHTDADREAMLAAIGVGRLEALFDDIHSGPTPYIVTTQGHVDHVGGVSLFRESGTRYVAHLSGETECMDCLRSANVCLAATGNSSSSISSRCSS